VTAGRQAADVLAGPPPGLPSVAGPPDLLVPPSAAAGVAHLARLRAAAELFGTPAYVYDLADVRRAHAQLRRALPAVADLYYALKANPHPAIAGELARQGCRTEVASAGEVDAALAAGFGAGEILLTGPAKSAFDIDLALTRGVRMFSVDSAIALARLGRAAARHAVEVSCLLRVNADRAVPGMGLSMTGTSSQFGADASWLLAAPNLFRGSGGARVTGLHLYMGTNIGDTEVLYQQFATGLRLAGALRRALGTGLATIDLGGGFGAPYARAGHRPGYEALRERLEQLCDSELAGWREGAVKLVFESGRYLAGSCGTLVSRVVDVKKSKGRTYVLLDTGVNHLGGMSGLRRLPRIVPDLISLDAAPGRGHIEDGVVAGPLCTPLDIWGQGVRLPLLRPGDLVAVPNVGAYGLTASLLAFLGHRAPVEVAVDTGAADETWQASRLALIRNPVAVPARPASR
jgi:diaminopimelate decarboxylase